MEGRRVWISNEDGVAGDSPGPFALIARVTCRFAALGLRQFCHHPLRRLSLYLDLTASATVALRIRSSLMIVLSVLF